MCMSKAGQWLSGREGHGGRLSALMILGLAAGCASTVAGGYGLPYQEVFEAPLTNGTPVSALGEWEAGAVDLSFVAASGYVFTETTRPISSSADAQILQLDTGSGGVTNFFDMPDSDQVVYMDAMLRLASRSSIPAFVTNDPSVQLFFFLNAATNLVVYHGGVDGVAPVMTELSVGGLMPNSWNRYTVTLDFVHGDYAGGERKYFKIQLNGNNLVSPQAYSSPGTTGGYDGGSWFFSVDQAGPDRVGSVVFNGEGGLDDLVLSTRAPWFSATPVYYINSELNASGSVQPEGEIPVVQNSTTQLVYQTSPWNEIESIQTNGIPIPAAEGTQSFAVSFFNVRTNVNCKVQFVQTMAEVDGKTPANWYGPLGADGALSDEDNDGLSLYEEYLVNGDPTVSNHFSITAFDPGGQMPLIGWNSLGLPNGAVLVEVSTNLTLGAWEPYNGYLNYAEGSTTWQSVEAMPEAGEFFFSIKVSE